MAMTRSKKSSKEENLMGSQEPSVRIAPKYKDTDGGDAASILALGGMILDPWQTDILED